MQAICKIAAGDNEVDRRMEATITTMEEMKARDAAAARLRRQVELLEKKSRRHPETKVLNDDKIAQLEDREFEILDMPAANINLPETFFLTPGPRFQQSASRSPSVSSYRSTSVASFRSPSVASRSLPSVTGPNSPPTQNTECEDFSDNSNPFSSYNPEWDAASNSQPATASQQQSAAETVSEQQPAVATVATASQQQPAAETVSEQQSAVATVATDSRQLPSGSSTLARRRSVRNNRGKHSDKLDI